MLIKILVTVVYAFLASPLVLFLVPESFFRELNENDDKQEMSGQQIMAIVVILLSVISSCVIFSEYNGRTVWYSYLLPACVPIAFDIYYVVISLKKKVCLIAIPILVLAFFGVIAFPLRDVIIPYEEATLRKNITTITEADIEEHEIIEEIFLSEKEILQKFGGTTIFGTYYNNGKTIYLLEDNAGNIGAAVCGADAIKFIPCQHKNETSVLRKQYKTEEIVELGIFIDKDIVYARFGILKRPSFLGKPVLSSYLILNMVEEEIQIEEWKY